MQSSPKLIVLFVCANESTTQQFNQLKHLFRSAELSLKSTDNDKFLSGDLVSRFDIAILANFDTDMTTDDFEMQAEFFDHYMNAPVSAYITTVKDRCSAELPASLAEKCRKQFAWDFPPEKAPDAVGALGQAATELAGIYGEEVASKVKPAFDKFDKDGSGAIDVNELKEMLASLGNNLDDEQLDAAYKDLDLNQDGVIDFEEFSAWYFSGMKSYTKTRRTLLKFSKGMSSFASSFGEAGLADVFKQDPRTITHKAHVSFNKPTDPLTTINAQVGLIGPKHEELMAQAKAFQAELGLEQDGSICFFAKVEVASTDETWASVEPTYQMIIAHKETKDMLKRRAGHLDIKYASGTITVRYMEFFSPSSGDFRQFYLPQEVVDSLRTVETKMDVKFQLNTSLEEIMKSEKPLSELALGGFNAQYNFSYMRKMAKLLQKFPPLAQPMAMGGFALGLSTDYSIELGYDDMDELKEHPMAGQFLGMMFNDLFNFVPLTREQLEKFDIDLSGIDEAKFGDDSNEKDILDQMQVVKALLKILSEVDNGASTLKFEGVHENLFTLGANVQAPGAGAVARMGMSAFCIKEDIEDALNMIRNYEKE